MKKLKYLNLILVTFVISVFSFLTHAYASSATVGFSGNSTVPVDSNITINLYVGNISDTNGGITSISSNLVFDSEYLEYVSGSLLYSGYQGGINPANNYKVSAVGTAGITTQTNVFSFVFKAKKTGTTQVSVANLKVSDNSGKFEATIVPKTITITGAVQSSDATLKSLGVTNYTLSPSFSKNTTSYSITVPEGTTSVNVTGSTTDSKAKVTGLGNVTLNGDPIVVRVTAEDGTPKEYTITVNTAQPKSSDNYLRELEVTDYTLSPEFNKNTTSYSITVPEGVNTINITGSPNDTKANVSGLGNITLTGNTVTVRVTAEDGTPKDYIININRESSTPTTGDATLKSLEVTGYYLYPSFDKNITNYTVTVPEGTTSVSITGTATDEDATIEGLGGIALTGDITKATITVTAPDGTTKDYIVRVVYKTTPVVSKSSDNALSSLKIYSSHEITPQFSRDVTAYNITVPYSVEKLDLSYYTSSDYATTEITGNGNFKVGEVNVVTIDVTAEDGSLRTYILNVTRSTFESDNNLKQLTVDEGELSPKFKPEVSEYIVGVDGKTDKLTIRAIADSADSKVEIIGNENLKEGRNTILVKVTDKNGFTKYYTINAYKEKATTSILGFTPLQFGLLLILFGILLLLLLLALLKRKKETKHSQTPIIEVKPEFNFGSKNSSDDDTVYGNLNQDSTVKGNTTPSKDEPVEVLYDEIEDQMPNDPYDSVVTKREIIEAIEEATRTKDPSKLKMLLKQEAINRKKKELKKQDELNNRDDKHDWR